MCHHCKIELWLSFWFHLSLWVLCVLSFSIPKLSNHEWQGSRIQGSCIDYKIELWHSNTALMQNDQDARVQLVVSSLLEGLAEKGSPSSGCSPWHQVVAMSSNKQMPVSCLNRWARNNSCDCLISYVVEHGAQHPACKFWCLAWHPYSHIRKENKQASFNSLCILYFTTYFKQPLVLSHRPSVSSWLERGSKAGDLTHLPLNSIATSEFGSEFEIICQAVRGITKSSVIDFQTQLSTQNRHKHERGASLWESKVNSLSFNLLSK